MQLTRVSETGFDSVRVHMHIIRSFENDVIRKKKMVAEDKAIVVFVFFALVWFWRRRAQRCSARESEGYIFSTTSLYIFQRFHFVPALLVPALESCLP